jgi:hypothetical protein
METGVTTKEQFLNESRFTPEVRAASGVFL